jgi:hypothetical protein
MWSPNIVNVAGPEKTARMTTVEAEQTKNRRSDKSIAWCKQESEEFWSEIRGSIIA